MALACEGELPVGAPSVGAVPDQSTTVAVASAVLTQVYGKEQMALEQPLKATLRGGVWTVEGTLEGGLRGGVASIELSKLNGCIFRISHGK